VPRPIHPLTSPSGAKGLDVKHVGTGIGRGCEDSEHTPHGIRTTTSKPAPPCHDGGEGDGLPGVGGSGGGGPSRAKMGPAPPSPSPRRRPPRGTGGWRPPPRPRRPLRTAATAPTAVQTHRWNTSTECLTRFAAGGQRWRVPTEPKGAAPRPQRWCKTSHPITQRTHPSAGRGFFHPAPIHPCKLWGPGAGALRVAGSAVLVGVDPPPPPQRPRRQGEGPHQRARREPPRWRKGGRRLRMYAVGVSVPLFFAHTCGFLNEKNTS